MTSATVARSGGRARFGGAAAAGLACVLKNLIPVELIRKKTTKPANAPSYG
jgi:hypothetical protein